MSWSIFPSNWSVSAESEQAAERRKNAALARSTQQVLDNLASTYEEPKRDRRGRFLSKVMAAKSETTRLDIDSVERYNEALKARMSGKPVSEEDSYIGEDLREVGLNEGLSEEEIESNEDAETLLGSITNISNIAKESLRRLNDCGEENIPKELVVRILEQLATYNERVESRIKAIAPANLLNAFVGDEAVGMRFMDISNAKLLLVQIPEDLYLRDGYNSVMEMMETMKQNGVVVVAIPETCNLMTITEEDLMKMDLLKVNLSDE
jgi:hypothetical protein